MYSQPDTGMDRVRVPFPKKAFFFLLAAMFVRFPAFSQAGQNAGDFRYVQGPQGGIIITGYTGSGKTIVIPDAIGGTPVIAIGNRAFRGMGITSVTMPESVESVGVLAFAENDIEEVSIPSGVRVIDTGAFSSNRIERVSIPDSVTVLRYNAFGKNPVREADISRNVRAIGPRVFSQNDLRRVSIGGDVEIYLGNFDQNFTNYYGSQNRQAGNYENQDGVWVLTQ
jgi:hypothetical protein